MRTRTVRASDADREHVARVLHDHAVVGRLSTDELDERTGRAFGARTLGELDALVADLPRDGRHGPAPAAAILTLLVEGVVWVAVGLVAVAIALLWAVAWGGARLASAVAARTLGSGRAPRLHP